MTREEIYDEQIAPLMTQIIATCKAHDIPIFATFDLDDHRGTDDSDDLLCTTQIVPKDASVALHRACRAFRGNGNFYAFTVVSSSPGKTT